MLYSSELWWTWCWDQNRFTSRTPPQNNHFFLLNTIINSHSLMIFDKDESNQELGKGNGYHVRLCATSSNQSRQKWQIWSKWWVNPKAAWTCHNARWCTYIRWRRNSWRKGCQNQERTQFQITASETFPIHFGSSSISNWSTRNTTPPLGQNYIMIMSRAWCECA